MKKLTLTLLIGFLFGHCIANETAKGYVYEDLNQNGIKDRREKGIAAVGVSNGEQIVLTDSEGYYELQIEDGDLLFVIKPSGYAFLLDSLNKPQFYYIHKPTGSPKLRYPGSAPTGDLPKRVDFGLIEKSEPDSFTALVFGDPQPYTLEEVDFFERGIVSEVEGIQDVAFGISLGDLVGDDLSLFKPYSKAVAKVGIPWFNVLGNHDENYDVDRDELADETFEEHFGPSTYSFNVGKVHFIILDDILWPDPRDGKGYWGGFRQDQLAYVENDLQLVDHDQLVVLAMHIPLSEGNGDSFRDEDRKRLFELLAPYPYTLSLSAHTHLQKQDYFDRNDGWMQDTPHHHYNVGTTSGDWYKGLVGENGVPESTMRDGTPKGYALLDFEGNQYKIRYQVAGKPSDYQMEIFNPKVVEKGVKTSAGIFVNFFMGSSGDEVLIKIGDGDWKNMNPVTEPDPSYLVNLFQWDTSENLMNGRRPSNPQDSKHLWRIPIPVNLDKGTHNIHVKATDRFGQIHYGESSIEIRVKN